MSDQNMFVTSDECVPSHVVLRGLIPILALSFVAGCQQKMAAQPSFHPDEPNEFFADGASSRQPVSGTVARGHLRIDAPLYFGTHEIPQHATVSADNQTTDNASTQTLLNAELAEFEGTVEEFPFTMTAEIVARGQNRYMIFCVVCHDSLGTGQGKIVERGYTKPPSYHVDRLRAAPPGYLFRIASQGYGSMPSYAGQIPVHDRWAIVAYIRALQLSQHFPEAKLPDVRRELLTPVKVTNLSGAP